MNNNIVEKNLATYFDQVSFSGSLFKNKKPKDTPLSPFTTPAPDGCWQIL